MDPIPTTPSPPPRRPERPAPAARPLGRPPNRVPYELRGVRWDPDGLRRARLRAGLSQCEVALMLDVAEITVRAWETPPPGGNPPPLRKVAAIAEAVGCETHELVDGDEGGCAT